MAFDASIMLAGPRYFAWAADSMRERVSGQEVWPSISFSRQASSAGEKMI